MSTNNIGFYGELTKIVFQLSSNTHLISSSAAPLKWLWYGTNSSSDLYVKEYQRPEVTQDWHLTFDLNWGHLGICITMINSDIFDNFQYFSIK